MPKTSRLEHYKREVSRVEGFSDAVFGFAVTLLVVSLDVPKTFQDLLAMMRGLPAFAVSFALLFQIWLRHYRFFRKYELEDGHVIMLTGALLFVVLFYVYPLKFLWSVVFSQLSGHAIEDVMPRAQVSTLFEIYGAGVAATYGLLAALYWHAYALRGELQLTAVEVLDTRFEIYRNIALAAIGLLSVAIAAVAAVFARGLVGIAGFVYFGAGISEWVLGEQNGRRRKRLQEHN